MGAIFFVNVTSADGVAGAWATIVTPAVADAASSRPNTPGAPDRRFLTMPISSSAKVRIVYTPGGRSVPRLILRVSVLSIALVLPLLAACSRPPAYDVVIRHGTIYDGTGAAGRVADLAIRDDRIAAVGDLSSDHGRDEVDATGLAVAPGFINMLSHSETSLIADGRAQGTIRQGVTLEVFGESSMGPLTEQMKHDQMERQGDIKFDISWNTLGEYLDHLEARGVSTNVASFVSAAT